ncbi:hypothetical protein ACI2KR_31415 [Pseudomonas luteola]
MSIAYRPRRARAHWVEGAPEYILSCHDNGGKTVDRYTIFFGGTLLDEKLCRNRSVSFLALSDNPSHPMGFSQWGECLSANRDACGKKIRWLDLPESIRNHIVARAAA